MDRIRIVSGQRLNGTIPISGAKNATLPLMIASLLTDQPLILENVPRLADVIQLQRILGNHGVDVLIAGKRPGDDPNHGRTVQRSTGRHARTTVISVDANGDPTGNESVPLSTLSTAIQNGLTSNAPAGATALPSTSLIAVRTINGVTTYSAAELDWVYRDGARRLLPEAWDEFARIAHEPDANLVTAYRAALDDDRSRRTAALAWCRWELDGMLAEPGSEVEAIFTDPRFAVCFARISTHYAAHHGFVDQTRLWETVPTLGHIPATIVQGRFDLCTPPATAWRLHRAWPGSTLHILDDQDHRLAGATDLVRACLHELADRIS